jgi:hypothetical protein
MTAQQNEALAARDDQGKWLNAQEAAARAGVKVGTWRAYVARDRAPRHGRRNPVTGVEEWLDTVIAGWMEGRPGQGARTDRKS